jgi:hypothetical protein
LKRANRHGERDVNFSERKDTKKNAHLQVFREEKLQFIAFLAGVPC